MQYNLIEFEQNLKNWGKKEDQALLIFASPTCRLQWLKCSAKEGQRQQHWQQSMQSRGQHGNQDRSLGNVTVFTPCVAVSLISTMNWADHDTRPHVHTTPHAQTHRVSTPAHPASPARSIALNTCFSVQKCLQLLIQINKMF